MTWRMPVSSARISWVLRAMRAEAGVGSAMPRRTSWCEGLGSAEHRRQRLDRGADDVVVRVLRGQADARSLTMRAQRQARLILGANLSA